MLHLFLIVIHYTLEWRMVDALCTPYRWYKQMYIETCVQCTLYIYMVLCVHCTRQRVTMFANILVQYTAKSCTTYCTLYETMYTV